MNKTNWILLAILLVQVGIIVFADRPWSDGRFESSVAEGEDRLFFPDLDIDAVRRIEITRGDRSLLLDRSPVREGSWEVRVDGGPASPADPFKVGALLDGVRRLEMKDVTSRSAEKKSLFGLDAASALDLTLQGEDGRMPAEILVGKSAGPMQGTYVCLPVGDEAYLVREHLRRACVGEEGSDWSAFWRDGAIFSADPDSVVGLKVTNPRGVFSAENGVERGGDGKRAWRVIGGDPALQEESVRRIRAMLAVLSSIRAQEVMPEGTPLNKVGLDDPEIIIEVRLSGAGAPTRVLSLSGEESGNRYLMMDEDASRLFKVNSFSFHVFQKPLE